MYTFFLMVEGYIKTRNLHLFIFFFAFIFIRWGIVFFYATRYKPYGYEDKEINYFTSMLILVIDEPLGLFYNVLMEVVRQNSSEIIVITNGLKDEGLEDLCVDFNRNLPIRLTPVQHYYTPVVGKRNGTRMAMEHINPDSDITALMDSDTVWVEDTLSGLSKPLVCDQKIGGVTTRREIPDPDRKFVTTFVNLLEETRAEGAMEATSVTGKVGCLPGRTIAFRIQILINMIYGFMNEISMGSHKRIFDDRSLTNLTPRKGYKTVMRDTLVIYIDVPTEWKRFTRQQLRWSGGSQYNNLKMTPWMLRNAKLMCFIYWSDMISPMMLVSVYTNIIVRKVLNIPDRAVPTLAYTIPW